MTGPEHYREAERILAAEASPAPNGSVFAGDVAALKVAEIHATLALAAATGVQVLPIDDREAWHRAAGVPVDGAS